MSTVKCWSCGKCYIEIEGQSECPFCNSDQSLSKSIFGDIFSSFGDIYKKSYGGNNEKNSDN